MPLALRPLLVLLLVILCWRGSAALAQQALQPDVRIRIGIVGASGDQRDGSTFSQTSGEGRIQAGVTWVLDQDWSLRAGVAARLSTEQEVIRLREPGYQPGPGGLGRGDIGVDQLFATWDPSAAIQLRVGRMQTRFVLPDVTGKSLQRNDTPGFNVLWIDGVHLRADVPQGGRIHLIGMYTSPGGVATAFRSPLRFGEGTEGRAGFLAGWEGRAALGPVIHRGLYATVLPTARPTPEGEDGAFAAVSAQGAVGFPLPTARVVVAGEAGWAPTALDRSVLGLSGDGEIVSAAGQLSLNLMGFGGGAHDLGLLVSGTSPGWLVSADFRPNSRDIEGRYLWRFAPRMRLDFRVRHRQDLVVPQNAVRGRNEWDFFVRYNVSF